MNFVVDSSVIIKWLNITDEDNIEAANKLLTDALDERITFFIPELAKYEVGNVLLKSKKLSPNEAYISLQTFYSLPLTYVSESEELAKQSYVLAEQLGITYYDASFLSLAKQYEATLVTDNIKHQGKTKEIKVLSLSDYSLV